MSSKHRTATLALALGVLTAGFTAYVAAAESTAPAAQAIDATHSGAHKGCWADLSAAERAAKHAERKARWDAMSDTERAAKHAEHKARWAGLSEEERAAKRAERKARWDAMSDEERAAHKAKWHEHHGKLLHE